MEKRFKLYGYVRLYVPFRAKKPPSGLELYFPDLFKFLVFFCGPDFHTGEKIYCVSNTVEIGSFCIPVFTQSCPCGADRYRREIRNLVFVNKTSMS